MKKKLMITLTALTLTLGLAACGTKPETTDVTAEPVVEAPETEEIPAEADSEGVPFSAEYEMKGTTSAGVPKSDTFIFEGMTNDGVITELNFDIIRDKGTDKEISKRDIMAYLMNVSDAEIEKSGDDYKLTKLSAAGFDDAFEGGQYMVSASADLITDTTTFKDLTFTQLGVEGEMDLDLAIAAYKYLAVEAGIEDLNAETLIKDIISTFDLYKDDSFVEGANRVSFAGYNGGRSYGEQMEAISAHILNEKMSLEDVYEMFKTANQMDEPTLERDTVSGATISFVGDFQRMVYVAMHGELFEGVMTHTVKDENTKVEVTTQGYGGEVETHVTFDNTGKITNIAIRDAQETPEVGGILTADDSEFINSLIAGQDNMDDVDVVSGATMTSEALIEAIQFATEYYNGL